MRTPSRYSSGENAAHQHAIVARIDAVCIRAHAGRVVERVLQVAGALIDYLVVRHDRHRLWRFRQFGVGLGGGSTALGEVAADRASRRFSLASHQHYGQRGRFGFAVGRGGVGLGQCRGG